MAGKLLIVTELGRVTPSTEQEALKFLQRKGVDAGSFFSVEPKSLRGIAQTARAAADLTAGVVAVAAYAHVWEEELDPLIVDHPSFFAPEVCQLTILGGWFKFRE